MRPDELAAVAGIRSLDEIAVQTEGGGKFPRDCRFFVRRDQARSDRGARMWQLVERLGNGAPRVSSTGVPVESSRDEARAGAVRRLAERCDSGPFGHARTSSEIGIILVDEILIFHKDQFLCAPTSSPTTVTEKRANATRTTRLGSIGRLRRAFGPRRLRSLSDGSSIQKMYDDKHISDSDNTRKNDLEYLKEVINNLIQRKRGAWLDFEIREKIRRGKPAPKADLTVEQMIRILLICAGLVWDKVGGCFLTEIDPLTGATGLVIAPFATRKKRAVIAVACLLALVSGSRQGALFGAKWYDRRAPHINFATREFDLGGIDFFNTIKRRGTIPLGDALWNWLAAHFYRSLTVNAEFILHKPNGKPYAGLNRTEWRRILSEIGIDHFDFHGFKAIAIEILSAGRLSSLDISQVVQTNVATIERNYRAVNAPAAKQRARAVIDKLLGGGEAAAQTAFPSAVALPGSDSFGAVMVGAAINLGDTLNAMSELLDATYAEIAEETAARKLPRRRTQAAHVETPTATRERPSWTPTAPVDASPGTALPMIPVARPPEFVTRHRVSEPCMVYRGEITDKEWNYLRPFLRPRLGAAMIDRRLALNGVIYVACTGISWRGLPERFGNTDTVRELYDRWAAEGGALAQIGQALASIPDIGAIPTDVAADLHNLVDGLVRLKARPRPRWNRSVDPRKAKAEWAPLTDREWAVAARVIKARTRGQRQQFDGLLWASTTGLPMRWLPPDVANLEMTKMLLRRLRADGSTAGLVAAVESDHAADMAPDARAMLAQLFGALHDFVAAKRQARAA
jgi:hypothetical protein